MSLHPALLVTHSHHQSSWFCATLLSRALLSRVAELDLLTSPVCNSEVMAAQRLVSLALLVSVS